MNLPPTLSSWSTYLNIFPEEISLALGPIIQRISLITGLPNSQLNEKAGEPDGFDGLNRRGTYERLLLSEWMLADELEDEFMRRAVMGEHLFLNPARSSPIATRASLALFDAGPSQLGSPRIAHIAALIVLANRADSASASFGWGVLQQPEQPIFREINASNVMQLLGARSHREVSDREIDAWETQLETWAGLDDVWLIGGQRLSRLQPKRRSSMLYVKDKLDPDTRQLEVACSSASGFSVAVTLDLPSDKISTRLLRDPFSGAVAEVQRTTKSAYTGAPLLFDHSANKLFTRTEKWGITAFNVPNSPRAGNGKPKSYHTRQWQTVCAVGRAGKAIALLSAKDGFVHVEFCRQGRTSIPAGNYTGYNQKVFFTPPADDGPLNPCFPLPWDGELAVVDGAGSLFRLARLKGDAPKVINGRPVVGLAQLVATEVRAVALFNLRLVYVGREWPDNRLYIVSVGENIARMEIPFSGTALRVFFSPWGGSAHRQFGLLAIEQSQFEWAIISSMGETILATPNAARVVGVLADESGIPGLIALEHDSRTITLNGRNWRKNILQANAPIEHVTVSHTVPYIAYSTVNGEIVIYSLRHRKDLCRYLPEDK